MVVCPRSRPASARQMTSRPPNTRSIRPCWTCADAAQHTYDRGRRSDCARRHDVSQSSIRAHDLVRVVRRRAALLRRVPRLIPSRAGAFVPRHTIAIHRPASTRQKQYLWALYHNRLNAVDSAEITHWPARQSCRCCCALPRRHARP
jgi:hypothetical protein